MLFISLSFMFIIISYFPLQVGGLVSNTEYWFRIRGCSAVGCGESTEPLSATIPAILPPDQKAPSSEFCKSIFIVLFET